MAGVEVRDYCGDFEDLTELMLRVWMPEYGGKVWVPIPEAAFLSWRFGPPSGAARLVAYHGAKPVGTMFSVPHPLRIMGSDIPGSLSTMFVVDPEYRQVALPLVEELRRHNGEQGIALTTGVVLGDPTSVSYRFWMKYAETFPQNFRFMFRGSYWAKFLAPQVLARAGLNVWERLASRTLGPMLSATPYRHDPHVRTYRAADLNRSVDLVNKATAEFDWTLLWPPERLSYLLANPLSGALVLERDGQLDGFVCYHLFMAQGREPVRAALIDLWADQNLTGAQRVRFVAHLCSHLRERDVHIVAAPRCAMVPSAAFVANLFVPMPEHFHVGVFLPPGATVPAPPRSWSLMLV
jgi:hypothetical protein